MWWWDTWDDDNGPKFFPLSGEEDLWDLFFYEDKKTSAPISSVTGPSRFFFSILLLCGDEDFRALFLSEQSLLIHEVNMIFCSLYGEKGFWILVNYALENTFILISSLFCQLKMNSEYFFTLWGKINLTNSSGEEEKRPFVLHFIFNITSMSNVWMICVANNFIF